MDLTTPTPTPTKSADSENDTPPHVQPIKFLSFTYGAIKKHNQGHHHLHQQPTTQPPHVLVTYKECLKNHVASIGGHAVDGCGEFMPSSTTSLKCAACGCHRNFHRREPDECCSSPTPITTTNPTTHFLDFKLHPLPHQSRKLSPTPSPPPPPPFMQPPMRRKADNHLLPSPVTATSMKGGNSSSGRKRFRTKFTEFQKEKMICFAEKKNWKMPKSDEYGGVEEFCNEVGITRGVLKVWMHNNKHTIISKKDSNNNSFEHEQ